MLMEGLMPYGGYTPVIAAVWDTHAAGSMGRIGSPVELNIGYAVRLGDIIHLPKQTALRVFAGIHLIGIKGEWNKRDKHSLLGRAKQLRGFGSQHLATVRVMGLVTNTETRSRFNLTRIQ